MAETLDRQALKALSTDTRQDIIKMLSRRPYTSSELSKLLKKHVTTIIEHLNVLEKANLVRKKDSTNKWVYYTLTGKGEKLFKPAYYSWVVTLSLSFVMLIGGIYQFFASRMLYSTPMPATADRAVPLSEATQTAGNVTTKSPVSALPTMDIALLTGTILIILAIFGFGYFWFRIRRSHRMVNVKL